MSVDIIFTLGIAAVLITAIVQLTRIMRTSSLHRTLRSAIEKGQPVTADLVEKLDRPTAPGEQDQRAGFVLIALGLAVFLAAAVAGSTTDNIRAMAGIAMFPLLVGAALLIRLRVNRNRDKA